MFLRLFLFFFLFNCWFFYYFYLKFYKTLIVFLFSVFFYYFLSHLLNFLIFYCCCFFEFLLLSLFHQQVWVKVLPKGSKVKNLVSIIYIFHLSFVKNFFFTFFLIFHYFSICTQTFFWKYFKNFLRTLNNLVKFWKRSKI